jgi:hypothetical protein
MYIYIYIYIYIYAYTVHKLQNEATLVRLNINED